MTIATSNQDLVQIFREATTIEGISISEQPCEICLAEGYEPIMRFVFTIAKDLSLLILANYLYDLIKTHQTNVTVGKKDRIISSKGDMLDVIKECQKSYHSEMNID